MLSKRDAKAAFERAGAEPVEVEALGAAWRLGSSPAPSPGGIRFLPFDDNYLVIPGGPRLFVPESAWAMPVPAWGSKAPSTLGAVKHLALRVVVDGPAALGLWEWDAAAGEVVVAPFSTVPRARREALDEGRSALAGFLRDELGHARSFSLDSDAQVQARAGRLRSEA